MRRALLPVVFGAALLALPGCGSSGADPGRAAAERYVNRQLAEEVRGAPPIAAAATATMQPDRFTLCTARSRRSFDCHATLSDHRTHLTLGTESWHVILAARRPAIALAQRTSPPAVAGATPGPGARPAAARARRPTQAPLVHLVVIPSIPTFVCIEDDRGRQLFAGMATTTVRATGRRLKLNLGLRSASVTVDGRPLAVPSSPYGVALTPTGSRFLPRGQRPCA